MPPSIRACCGNREQFEAIRHSNALAKIREMPIVQMGLAFYNFQLATPESDVAKIDAVLRNPESRKMLDLAAEMASDEIFIYGDERFVDFVKLFQIVNAAQTYSPAGAAGDRAGGRPEPPANSRAGRSWRRWPNNADADRRAQPDRRLQTEEHRSGQGTTDQAGDDGQRRCWGPPA